MATNQKPNFVEIWIYNGKEIPLKITQGKVYGGIVNFKESDPMFPVVWLGQKSYRLVNPRNKKNILFYDSLSHTLFKPSELAGIENEIDMVTQMSQNVMMGGNAAKEAMGMNEGMNRMTLAVVAGMIVVMVVVLVFLYLLYQHAPTPQAATTAATVIKNATTTIPHTIGPQIVPSTG